MTTFVLDTSFSITSGYSHDATSALQSAINTATTNGEGLIITQQYGIQVTDGNPAITLPSNAQIKFAPGGAFRLLPHNAGTYEVFLADVGTSNVLIEDAVIDCAKENNSATTGEWGMGISLYDTSNVTLIRPTIKNCWGDGLYLGGTTGPSNTNIVSPRILGARRNGMSVIGANGLNIWEFYAAQVGGTAPQTGIDFEPDSNSTVFENIHIYGARTVNCNTGISFYFDSLPGTNAQNVYISISDWHDYNSTSVGLVWENLNKGSYSVTGGIYINSPFYIKPATKTATSNWDNSVTMNVSGERDIV